MRSPTIHKKAITMALVAALITPVTSIQTQAASKTGHKKAKNLIERLVGFDVHLAQFGSNVNQMVDEVPLSAATQSGMASDKLHFPAVKTPSDLKNGDLLNIQNNNGKRTLMGAVKSFVVTSSTLRGVGALGNAEGFEMAAQSLDKGNATGFFMGMHYAMDMSALFHDGYLGSLNAPIPGLNRFLKVPLGHLVDGTSPDELTVAKIYFMLENLGPFLIAFREAQNGVGVDNVWLEHLKAQGVNVMDASAIATWFFKQKEIEQVLRQELRGDRVDPYVDSVLTDLRFALTELGFISEENYKYMDENLALIKTRMQKARLDMNESVHLIDLVKEFANQAWKDGKFNEPNVIAETTTDYRGKYEATQRLDQLIIEPSYLNPAMPQYVRDSVEAGLMSKSTNAPYTRGWILDQITEKLTRGMLHSRWSKFNYAFYNEDVKAAKAQAETDAIDKMEMILFKNKSIYMYENPKMVYWNKVFKTYWSLTIDERGNSLFRKAISFFRVILATELFPGYDIHNPRFTTKVEIFFKTIGYLFSEELKNPLTTKGNLAVRFDDVRDRLIKEIRVKYPDGIMTEATLAKNRDHFVTVQSRYNDSNQRSGLIQKTAGFIVDKVDTRDAKKNSVNLSLRCENVHLK